MRPRPEGPDFIGVGVEKCGSTWLAEVVAQHPGIFLPKKEIHFFCRKFHKGYSWYHNWFSNKNGRIAGEFSPLYMITPLPKATQKEKYPQWKLKRKLYFWRQKPSARDEIKAHYPGIRVFAIFRNPVERTWSAYWHWKRHKDELGKRVVPFEKLWAADGRWIKTQGLFAHYLTYWREAFSDFGVFFYDDIKLDPLGLAKAIFQFIGVNNKFTPDISHWPLKGTYEPMPLGIREMLLDFYREQILKFSIMAGRDLSHWLKVQN